MMHLTITLDEDIAHSRRVEQEVLDLLDEPITLEPSEDGGYTAIVPALPGCLSEGDTREEVLTNVREAIAIYLEPIEDDGSTLSPEGTLHDHAFHD